MLAQLALENMRRTSRTSRRVEYVPRLCHKGLVIEVLEGLGVREVVEPW